MACDRESGDHGSGENDLSVEPVSSGIALVSLVATLPADPSVLVARLEGNERIERARRAVASRASDVIGNHSGWQVAGNGESITAAFGAPSEALDFALELQFDTGSRLIRLRVAAHVDVVADRGSGVACGDVGPYDDMLAFTRQLLRRNGGTEVWTSNDFKTQIDHHGTTRQRELDWMMRPNCVLDGYEGRHILWSVNSREAAIP